VRPHDPAETARDYFKTLHVHGDAMLDAILRRSNDHGDILATEQVIQDYLAAVFQPFVGSMKTPRYIRDEVPQTAGSLEAAAARMAAGRFRFGLVGAHYRSSLSAKGRRSAFALQRRRFLGALRELVGEARCRELTSVRIALLETLWEAVYLEQYFSLFDRKLTLGEWAFEQGKRVPIVVLAEGSVPEPRIREFRNELHLQQIIVVPKALTQTLLSKSLLRTFAEGVADGILGAIGKERAALRHLMRHDEGYPDKQRISAWSRLTRAANALARHAIGQSAVEKELALRHSYATGMVFYQDSERALRQELLQLFPPAGGGDDREQPPPESDQLAKLLRVLQSLQFYTLRYGENCVTFPYWPDGSEAPGAGTPRGEGFHSSITLFWDGSRNLNLLRPIVEGARGVFDQLNTAVRNHLRARLEEGPREDRQHPEVLRIIKDASGDRLGEGEVSEVLTAARDLSRALYEGKPRAFSFILGSPEWLISDLSVVHDLMGSGVRYQVQVTGDEPYCYDRTLALLRGNSAFFQDDSLALFLPYPGRPLEVTHVVRLPREGSGRRQLLSAFSQDKLAVVAVATYGSGLGELIHLGEVKAVLSAEGQWVPASGYHSLIDELTNRIAALEGAKVAAGIVERLKPCLQRLSEEPGVGGLFVIAREVMARRLLQASISLTEVLETIDGRSLPELDARAVYDLARDDGATVVAVPSMRVWGRRLLAAGLRNLEEPANGSRFEIQILEWGTRRRTALQVSRRLAAEGLVVVVSSDGPITLLQDGAIVAQFGERGYARPPRRGVEKPADGRPGAALS